MFSLWERAHMDLILPEGRLVNRESWVHGVIQDVCSASEETAGVNLARSQDWGANAPLSHLDNLLQLFLFYHIVNPLVGTLSAVNR